MTSGQHDRSGVSDAADDFATLHELIEAAHTRLDPALWDYLVGGGGSETTLVRNRLAFDSLALRPRVLRNIQGLDCGTSIFGRAIGMPVALAPVGSVASFDPGGLVSLARAAQQCNVPVICGGLAETGMEDVATSMRGPKVYQAYVRGEDDGLHELADRATRLGYDAFCLTVDSTWAGRRERDIARRFVKPWAGSAKHLSESPSLSWSDVALFKSGHALPLVLKGIATAEDAKIAVEHGVEVIYVSNHGGRQLDHGRGSLDVLPEVVAAVAGRASVWVDGGICRGTDVIKALALGADLVGIGRLYLYGVAAAGQAGVERVLHLLQAEIIEALALCGVTSLAMLDNSFIAAAQPVRPPHALSAFPLLER